MMIDLASYCGLDITLDTDKAKLLMGEGLNFSSPGIRTLAQMQEVLLDRDVSGPQELYYMYRDVYRTSDKPLLDKNKLRYDVTLIRPEPLGRELMKTAGHYHPGIFGELYEVVHGRCFCLLQRANQKDHKIIEEVIICEAEAGSKIVIPPYFGHILINPGPDYLVTSNWVSSVFKSEYELYKHAQGAAYYLVGSSDKKLEYVANPNYKKSAKIKFVKPAARIDKFGLIENKPMYLLIEQNARNLEFLNHPQDFHYSDVFVE